MKEIKPQRDNTGIPSVELMLEKLKDIKRECVTDDYWDCSNKYRMIAWRAIPCIIGIENRLKTLKRILGDLADAYSTS